MRAFFAKHFYAIVLAIVINVPHIWRGIIFVTDWLSRIEFWATYSREFPGVSKIIEVLANPPPWTVFITTAIGVGIVLLDVRRQAHTLALSLDLSQKLRLAFFSGCTAVAISIWIIAWPLYFPATGVVVEGPTTPKPKPQEPPKPPPPWVSQEEIDAQRKLGRSLLNYSPEELLAIWSRGGNIGAYLNKWIKIDYPFPDNGLTVETIDKQQYDVVKMNIAFSFISKALSAYFDQKNGMPSWYYCDPRIASKPYVNSIELIELSQQRDGF